MKRTIAPRLVAALGFLGLITSFACFPITMATFPLPEATVSPSARPSSPSRSPSPARIPTPTASADATGSTAPASPPT